MQDYQPFLISNFRTGFDESLEPWMLPRDGYQIVKNAHLYRGVIEKISGYGLYARMSYRETILLSPAPNGVVTTFTGTLNHQPSSTNLFAQAATNAGATAVETWSYGSDTAPNIINLVSSGGGTGTINLTTLAVSITFNVPPAIVGVTYNAVIFSYDFLSTASAGDQDIMGIKPYYFSNGSQDILIFDTNRVGKAIVVTGLISTALQTDYSITEIPHEVQAENVTPNPAFNGAVLTFTGTLAHPIVPGHVQFFLYDTTPAPPDPDIVITTITDNGMGLLTGTGTPTATGFVNYFTGAWTLTFSAAPAATDKLNSFVCIYGDVFTGDYTNFFSVINYQYKAFITNNKDNIRYYDGSCLKYLNTNVTNKPGSLTYDISKCLHVFVNRERLLLILPTILGSTESSGIYWSVAQNPLNFTNDEILIASTSESIKTFGFINSDLVVRFSNSERIFRYTGDAFDPFRWDSTNNVWRCDAKYSAINYDSYFSSVGKPAIVASDGVNIKRADEIIPDFTLNDRAQLEGPIISIQQTSIGQCYGERFDDFKEGWLCFKAYTESGNSVARSDNVLAYNYLDETYAVYTFPFNCLGFGTVAATNTWGNNFTPWEEDDDTWDSFFENLDALIDLAGDQFGNVYILGTENSRVDSTGTRVPVLFDVISKNFNPFIEQGEMCRFGYLDLFVSSNAQSKLRVQIYANDAMQVGPDGNPTGPYYETTLTFNPTDSTSSVIQYKVWKRLYIGAIAKTHTIRLYQATEDFTVDTLNQPIRIHAMVLYMKPSGRIFN